MKLIGLSDPHGTSKIPRGRLGNPLSDFWRKMKFVFKLASSLDNAPVLIAGDLFNTPRDVLALFKFLSITMRYPDVPIFAVYGQHDMYMRNKQVINNLAILARSGVIRILGAQPIQYGNCLLFGKSWGDKYPRPKKPRGRTTVFVAHHPITKEALFPGHKFKETGKWLKRYGRYDFILLGDIHRSDISYYTMKNESRGVVANTGPMMRLWATEYMKEHKPKVAVFDTDSKTFEVIHIPVAPVSDILNYGIHEEAVTEESLGDLYIETKQIEEINVLHIIEMLLKKAKNRIGIREVLIDVAKEIDGWQ